MLELAAAAWRVAPENVLLQAAVHGLPVAPEYQVPGAWKLYLTLVHTPRQQARAFWKQAQQQFIDAPGAHALQWMVGVQHVDSPLWATTGREYVGATTPAQAMSISSVRTMRNTTQPLRRYRKHWLLPGDGWGLLLTIPFYDLPGRICGFFYAGRKWDATAGDYQYARAPEFAQTPAMVDHDLQGLPNHGYCEAGIAMALAATHGRYSLFDNDLIVLDEPVLATKLQLRFLHASAQPAPLVATYTSPAVRTTTVWRWTPADRLVFWSTAPDLAMLWQARNARGYISTCQATERVIATNLRTRPAATRLQLMRKDVISWEESARERLRTESATAAENTLLSLGLTGGELRQFIADCDTALAARLTAIQAGQVTLRQIVYDDSIIYEDDKGWFTQQAFQICNFVLHIERSLVMATGKSAYQGYIQFQGQAWNFLVPSDRLDRTCWAWIRKFLQQKRVGVPICAIRWRKCLVDIALRLHPPVSQAGYDVVGWDAPSCHFILPNYSMGLTGEVNLNTPCVALDPLRPATAFVPPAPIPVPVLQVLDVRNTENAVIWGTLACILAGVLAPAMRHPSQGIVLRGVGAHQLGTRVALACGCPRWARRMRDTAIYDHRHYRHRWPVVTGLAVWLRWAQVNADAASAHAVLTPPAISAHALNIDQRWNSVICNKQLSKLPVPAEALANICGGYLQDICRRKFQLEPCGKSPLITLLNDIASWYKRQGGHAAAVRAAHRMLEWPGHPDGSVHFMRLLFAVVNQASPAATAAAQPVMAADSVWVPQQPVLTYNTSITAIPLNAANITQALAASGGLIREETRDGQLGWTVAADWFTNAWQQSQNEA
jgi:hypothetical protein